MSKKDATETEEVEPVIDPPPPSYTDGPTVRKTERILVWGEGDTYSEFLHDEPRDREVAIGGTPYAHCDTLPDGTWVYRNDRKN